MIKAFVYARFSSENQDSASIDAQIRAIEEYAQSNNITIIKTYIDEAKSATTDNRPEFLRMFNDINNIDVDAVLVHKLDRFARNRYDSAHYRKKLKDKNIKLISVIERLDDSPESILLTSIVEGFAEYFSANLAREVMKGLKENGLKAKHNGGSPPLGYDVAPDKTYILNEHEAQAVKIMFDGYSQGLGYGHIINELNSKGYRTKNNKPFGKNSIFDILRNEKYTGTYIYNKRKNGTNRVQKSPDEIIRVENAMPAIVTSEQWRSVQDKLDGNKKNPSQNALQTYVLTGHMFCGCCEGAYVGNSYYKNRYGTKYYMYSCTNRSNKKGCKNKNVNKELIEKQVIKTLKQIVFKDIDLMANKAIKLGKEIDDDKAAELKILSKKVDSLQKKIDKLLDAYLDGTLDKDTYNLKSKSLVDDKINCVRAIEELTAKNSVGMTFENMKEFLQGLRDKLDSDNFRDVREVVETLDLTIVIHPDKYRLGSGVRLYALNHTLPYPKLFETRLKRLKLKVP